MKPAALIYMVFFLLLSPALLAQVPDTLIPESSIEQKIEWLLEETDAETDATELTEALEYRQLHPLNLNAATAEELFRLSILDPLQIESLLEHRRRYGSFQSLYELGYISGFDMPVINKLLPYVQVAPVTQASRLKLRDLQRGRHQLFIRYQEVLEEQKGYSTISDSLLQANPNSRYLGSPQKIYMRYSYTLFNRWSAGITAEKDAGEEFFSGNRKNGFDFYSAHLAYSGKGIIRNLVLGDYSVNMGQGLVCYSGLSFGKSSAALNIHKRASVLRRYTSSDENRFFRGAAATIALGSFEFTGFGSMKKADARIASVQYEDAEDFYISSLQETGLHTTPSEVANRKTVGQTIYGGRLAYNSRRLNMGLSHINTTFDKPIGTKNQLYQSFDFSGNRMANSGIDLAINLNNLLFFGEAAVNAKGATAMTGGMLASPDPRLGIAVLYRDYSIDYNGLYVSGFGEASNTNNEKGLYTGIRLQPGSKLSISAYADFFRFPWLRYRVDQPSDGMEYLVQADYNLSRSTSMYIRYKTETKGLNPPGSSEMITRPADQNKQSFRYNLDYRIAGNVRLRSRYELSFYSLANKKSFGHLILQDVIIPFKKPDIQLYLRYALFDTDDYDTRIYTFENDVLYAFSVPSFYDRGSRRYFMLRYKISSYADLWVKLSRTTYSDRLTIGSGLTEIEGNNKTELRVQLRLRW